jgi:hypothetical protein
MSKATLTPDEYMAALEHPLKDAVVALRGIIRGADKRFDESIKWNSFNYSLDGADRITFNVRGADKVLIIFHAGARAKACDLRQKVADPAGMLAWPSKDRAIASFGSPDEVKNQKAALAKLVKAWIAATAGV